MEVIIDGVKYMPKCEFEKIQDKNIEECLKILTSMRYFGQDHKMMAHTWEAIESLSPNLSKLEPNEAYKIMHGDD